MPDQQQTRKATTTAETVDLGKLAIPPVPEHARRVVQGVLANSLAKGSDAYEHKVFTTPGVIEALDDALREVATLKRRQ